ncbi:hypothetical protein [Phaeovulum sp. W22_SRMD_FR3]|uniref:hypothetical protein n=1 Tax=Phaeovulum sp. W22_SRMD_FR3 TaxID=3240274 RepID=UPI003F99FE32
MSRVASEKIIDSAKETLADAKARLAGTDSEALAAQVEQLRIDLARISDTLQGMGRAQGEAVAETVRSQAARLYDISGATLTAAADRASATATEAQELVRRQPAAAVGLAAGAGLLAGLFLARK